MGKIAIVTDSTATLPAPLLEQYGILVVPVLLHIDNQSYRDGIDITPGEFYQRMRSSSDGYIPKTAAPSVGEFFRAYTLAAQGADEILSIHLSKNLTAVFQVACTARDLVPIPVHVVDTETAAMGCGFAVLEAARLAQTGASVEQIIERTMDVATRSRVLVMLARMDYLHRGGRVPAIAALAGSILKLCPILNVGGGEVRILQVPRTEGRAAQRMAERLEREAGGRPVHLAVMHGDAPQAAEALYERICKRVSAVESYITEFTPVMGAHTGPDLLGVAYYVE